MKSWTPRPPAASDMGDHDVPLAGTHLQGRRIALLVCGGIAAMKTPMIARALRRYGADVVAYLSGEATKYVTVDALQWATNHAVISNLSPSSEHLSKEHPFDAYLVAPATYNTINKFRHGVGDTPVTATLSSALGLLERKQTKILVAPTMHGDMHNSVLQESLETLQAKGVTLIPPRDDYGKHNIPDSAVIAAYVCAELSTSPLKNLRILLTAGATPTPIDNVRAITNRFRGRLGVEIARELIQRGADVKLVMGAGGVDIPSYIDSVITRDFEAYRDQVLSLLTTFLPAAGIFSAAVADYAPAQRVKGKIPSGGALKSVELVPTEKVIDLVRSQDPNLPLMSFKYQELMSLDELLAIAQKRVAKGHIAVVANRGEEKGPKGEQIAYLVSPSADPFKMMGKTGIAIAICDWLEKQPLRV